MDGYAVAVDIQCFHLLQADKYRHHYKNSN